MPGQVQVRPMFVDIDYPVVSLAMIQETAMLEVPYQMSLGHRRTAASFVRLQRATDVDVVRNELRALKEIVRQEFNEGSANPSAQGLMDWASEALRSLK